MAYVKVDGLRLEILSTENHEAKHSAELICPSVFQHHGNAKRAYNDKSVSVQKEGDCTLSVCPLGVVFALVVLSLAVVEMSDPEGRLLISNPLASADLLLGAFWLIGMFREALLALCP